MGNTIANTARSERMRSVLRIVAALLYWQHGAQKLIGYPGNTPPVDLTSLMGAAGIIEFFGGLLLLVGLLTRPVAFLVAGEMAFAYFMAHAPRAFWPIENQGEPAALFCFIWLFFAVAGAGAWSIDALLSQRVVVHEDVPERVAIRAVR
jgi:putative oxidoreductase